MPYHLMLPQLVSARAGYQGVRRGGASGDCRTGCGSPMRGRWMRGMKRETGRGPAGSRFHDCRPPGMAGMSGLRGLRGAGVATMRTGISFGEMQWR